MKVKMTQDWSAYKKGQIVECKDAEGCHLIGTGVADVVEVDKPTAKDLKGSKQVAPEKGKDE